MSKFTIECPSCHRYAEASTGFFAKKRIPCACGHIIDVRTEKMTSRKCESCGNTVLLDQSEGKDAKCPVCHAPLITDENQKTLIQFRCTTCGCELSVNKAASRITCPVCDTVHDVPAQVKLQEQRMSGEPAVISYEGDNQTFVYKHPLTDFVMGSTLIVHESQEAIFLRGGEALDSFSAGSYTLETGILPKMDQLYKLPTGGSQPFHAEVYFVNLATQMGIKWGTSSKVGVFDPISGMHVELGASGSFNLRVTDARRLLLRLVGTTSGLSQDQLFSAAGSGYFRTLVMTKVKSTLARIIKENRINVLEIDAHLDTISSSLRAAINGELQEYGLTMPEFYVANILTPDDDPNFRRMKQQHADMYLRVREEEIRKAEAEAAFERKSVEAQTSARMKIIGAQGDAEVTRLQAQAQADAYRMQAEAEAQEMRMKGYTYQQETARQVGLEAMRMEGGTGGGAMAGLAGMTGDLMGLGIGLGTMGSVIGMTKDAVMPIMQAAGGVTQPAGWSCSCGAQNITTNFCPNCGSRKPEEKKGWDCSCGEKNIMSNFCPNCGSRKPEEKKGWDCSCGQKNITTNFCPNCGSRKPEEKKGWTCSCGQKDIATNFCPNCGTRKGE